MQIVPLEGTKRIPKSASILPPAPVRTPQVVAAGRETIVDDEAM